MKTTFFIRFASLAIVALPVTCGTPSSFSAPPPLSTITIAGHIFVIDPANPILNSTTVRPGSAGISINGQIVSADAADDLYVDGTEILLRATGATSAAITTADTTASLSSSGSQSAPPRSISASSITATAAGLNLESAIVQVVAQVASNRSIHSVDDIVTASASASASMTALSSKGTVSSGVATTSLASSLSGISPARATSNVTTDSQPQSLSVGSKTMTASTSKIKMSPLGSFIHNNSSSGLHAVSAASEVSKSVSSGAKPLSSAGTSSHPTMLVPGAQPNTITTGPTWVMPTISLNPTGSVASSQGMLLVGAIFGITAEAKTLSAIIKDDGPKESFISKIKGTDDDILDLLEDIHPPDPPPSYESACLNGVSILDIIKILGCLKSGLDEVVSDLKDEPPDVIKIQSTFDNLGKLAKNLEDEDEDDDKETSATQDSATKASSTSTASSRVSSSSSTASEVRQAIGTFQVVDPMPSDDKNLGIADQAFMTFLGDILSSAMGIGSSPSGFAVSFSDTTGTLHSPSSAAIPSIPTAVGTSSSRLSSAVPAASSSVLGGGVAQSTTAAISSPVSSSNPSIGNVASEIAHREGQIASSRLSALSAALLSTTAQPNPALLISAIDAIAQEIKSNSAVASSAAAAAAAASSSSLIPTSTPAPNPLPTQPDNSPKYGIYLAYQTFTQGGANAWTQYFYKIWVTDLTLNPAGPDFCAAQSWIANVQVGDAVDANPPYPTKDFSFTIPAGEMGEGSPAVPCIWSPSPGNSQPGSVACNPGETVLCSVPAGSGIICKGDDPDRILPLAQCVFQ